MRSPFDLSLITPEANRAEGVGSSDTSLSIGGGQSSAYGATLDGAFDTNAVLSQPLSSAPPQGPDSQPLQPEC